ncbi:hypothetical protein M493_03045 [Geobacillus genomosp. 3]|uniref:Uncharacterized protein n=1 Tax=Geobacillus genomosp. 3 TaxID=1921421 RepID=S5Z1R9_GEOG3|nr:hypothetical protein M493_03045 [Geobacillus genomosp. 3]
MNKLPSLEAFLIFLADKSSAFAVSLWQTSGTKKTKTTIITIIFLFNRLFFMIVLKALSRQRKEWEK